MIEPVWQAVTCPVCSGKGTVIEVEWEEDDGYGDQRYEYTRTCNYCDGKRFVKIDVSKLNERN